MHGLPTENATEKELGLKNKYEIEKFGVGKFTKACKELAIRNLKLMNEDFKKLFSIIKIGSIIESINLDNWINAAKTRHKKREKIKNFGLMDAIILAKQIEIEGKIVTGDSHFKNQKNVEFLS